MSSSAPQTPRTVRIVRRHHLLVRLAHWANVPLLLGLIASGLSIHWAAPVFTHAVDPVTGSRDLVGDLSVALARLTGDTSGAPRDWIVMHLGLGTFSLASALRLHWLLVYLFMLNGALYLIGLWLGGGWRALAPRRGDGDEAARMARHYLGVLPALVRRRPHPHPQVRGPYNALQRGAYLVVLLTGVLEVASGWAMHKPASLGWLERMFGDYDGARVVHFVGMVVLGGFIVPHVVLVAADGFDTFRSMVTGWSARVKEDGHGQA